MKSIIPTFLLMGLLLGSLRAEEVIPASYGPSRYEALWFNPPFLRSLNAAESYVITGVSNIDGKPLVTLTSITTGERFMLSNVKNSHGWRLISLRSDPNPKNVVARVSVYDEEMTVRYDEKQLSAAALLKAAQGVTGQAPSGTPNPGKPFPSPGNKTVRNQGSAPAGPNAASPPNPNNLKTPKTNRLRGNN